MFLKRGADMNYCENHRFIERDFWVNKAIEASEYLTLEQIEIMLDRLNTTWRDLTFKFYQDGSVSILDNDLMAPVSPGELTGACLDFYVRKRIQFIKSLLVERQLQYA
ncbi:hypothetical protein [Paenibacillus gansuensis]|uniref:Uncharacterized protein n=1 Tax=Paenibacillus gansuensis TaxID=306542 RepID=A0ABW5PAV5_9BACL